jgi:hypothetical protein
MPQFKKGAIQCPVCNGSMTIKEVIQARSIDLDKKLCFEHFAELWEILTGLDIKAVQK